MTYQEAQNAVTLHNGAISNYLSGVIAAAADELTDPADRSAAAWFTVAEELHSKRQVFQGEAVRLMNEIRAAGFDCWLYTESNYLCMR